MNASAAACEPPGARRPKILVREAGSEDALLIAELTRAAWAGMVPISSSGHRETENRVLDDLQDGGAFLLTEDDQPAGSVRWLPLDGEPQVWEVFRMGVLPQFRGKRLSEYLLEAVIHRALDAGIDELRLAVHRDQERLLDLYAAYGFERAPELEYRQRGQHGDSPIVMRRRLRS